MPDRGGDSVVLKSLLEAGADPYIRNKEGITALQVATKHDQAPQDDSQNKLWRIRRS
jgi:ankyrin repeat protein